VTLIKTKSAQHYFVVLCGTLALYIVSCAPGALWQDSGLIQYRIWHNDIEGFLGLAISHPLFYILAIGVKYIPLGEFAIKGISFDRIWKNRVKAKFGDTFVWFASLDDL